MDEYYEKQKKIDKLLNNSHIFYGTDFKEQNDVETYELYLDIYKKICERENIEYEKDEKMIIEQFIEKTKKESSIEISYLLNYEVFKDYLMNKAEKLNIEQLKDIKDELYNLIISFRDSIAEIIRGGFSNKLYDELSENPELFGLKKTEKETIDDSQHISENSPLIDFKDLRIDLSEFENFKQAEPKPEVTKEDIKRYMEFLTVFEKLNAMINNLKNNYNDFKYYEQQRQLEEYYKDEEFIESLKQIMEHNPEEEEYRYHGTQSLKDGQAIMKTGLLMASDNLDRTSYSEFQMEQLLLYQRGGFIAQVGDKCVVIFRVPKGENIVKKINSEDYSFSQSGLGGFGNGPKYIVEPENIVGYVDKENHLVVNNPNFVKNKGISR